MQISRGFSIVEKHPLIDGDFDTTANHGNHDRCVDDDDVVNKRSRRDVSIDWSFATNTH